MKITTDGNLKDKISDFFIQTFSLLFFPDDNIFGKNGTSENYIKIFINKDKNFIDISVDICYNKKTSLKSEKFRDTDNINYLFDSGKLFYKAAGEITGIYPPWGIHTGIRPAKIAGSIYEKNNNDEIKTLDILNKDYLIDKNKAALALETFKNGKSAFENMSKTEKETEFSLYISIPFCPTRCKYCSFVSFSTPRLLNLIPEYIKRLTEEAELTGKIVKNMRLKTVYIGGGTPTTLDCNSLEAVLTAVKNNFDLSGVVEYTVECGRADTITEEKLELLKKFDVDRISINPQTLNNDILKGIGRNHTAEDFFHAFELAKKVGIKNINADCIVGLPNESEESMINTIKNLAELNPENITIHTLCIKKSAELKKSDSKEIYNPNASNLNNVLEKGYEILSASGYKPYYMYRQKYASGNLENTGFCLDNRECLYNILMMDEMQTIFGIGASSMTKIVKNDRIERIANYKYPYEYIERDLQINKETNREKLKLILED